jgi:SAM-dependent MidA family methyltransferase
MAGMSKILADEIQAHGVITFARFMELALYGPEYGYYEREEAVIGRAGDYYTSVSAGSLFGELLAFQFAEWLERLSVRPLRLVEAGAHGGNLCADILSWLARERQALYEATDYWIIEPSVVRQAWQKANLEKFAGRVYWAHSISSLAESGVTGVIFSNELLDAMPVRRLGWDAQARRWFEWGVTMEGRKFVWQKCDVSQEAVAADLENAHPNFPSEVKAALPDQFTVEICPAAGAWWTQASRVLVSGRLMTIDFGFTVEELLASGRQHGTLRSYHRHHATNDLLAHPGEQDLTAHVNFTQLQCVGEAMGLQTEGLLSQEQFLTLIATKMCGSESSFGRWTSEQVRQFQTLTHPEHLGRAFRVLIQCRNG